MKIHDGMKADERALAEAVLAHQEEIIPLWKLAEGMGIAYKRAEYIAEKWGEKDWYDWGVAWRYGWLRTEANHVG